MESLFIKQRLKWAVVSLLLLAFAYALVPSSYFLDIWNFVVGMAIVWGVVLTVGLLLYLMSDSDVQNEEDDDLDEDYQSNVRQFLWDLEYHQRLSEKGKLPPR